MIELLLAGAVLTAPLQTHPGAAARAGSPVTLEDVTVTGRPLEELIRNFVVEVAEPNRHRGLARWDDRICVGVANLQTETAQFMADRISTVAADLGLDTGGPGCTPNILVVATDDANALAATLVAERGRAFRLGGSGMDRGGDALEDFVRNPRPVRWWQMSMPTNSETGERAIRLPGECLGSCTGPGSALDYAPKTEVFAASRIRTQIVDDLTRAIVLIDVDEVAHLSIMQLADYIAMVSLAQIDPDADTTAYASILNVMKDPTAASGLMDWDRAYLGGLYDAERNASSGRAQRGEVVDSIRTAHRRIRDESGDEGGEGVSE
ncbi:MAG TPA: hypothetical protein VFF48_00295 [Brevundimonas sp.]|nr:hypothetical protein [Brevundimonas sp.]